MPRVAWPVNVEARVSLDDFNYYIMLCMKIEYGMIPAIKLLIFIVVQCSEINKKIHSLDML